MRGLDSITNSADMNLKKIWDIVEDRGAGMLPSMGSQSDKTKQLTLSLSVNNRCSALKDPVFSQIPQCSDWTTQQHLYLHLIVITDTPSLNHAQTSVFPISLNWMLSLKENLKTYYLFWKPSRRNNTLVINVGKMVIINTPRHSLFLCKTHYAVKNNICFKHLPVLSFHTWTVLERNLTSYLPYQY